MKSIFLALLIKSTLQYDFLSATKDCTTCLSSSTQMVCRDFNNDVSAVCCSLTETGRACTQRDFCSNSVKS